jgi:poly-gamma-glutamate synthesis protein (capsule biosynthesis protein)
LVALVAGCHAPPVRERAPISGVAAGDLQPGGPMADPLMQIAPLLRGELRFVNLESPLTSRGVEEGLDAEGRPLPGARIRFAAPPARAAWLRGRFDVASLANNHALDQGEAGRDESARTLASAGVRAAWEGHDAPLAGVTVLARDFTGDESLEDDRGLAAAVRAARARGPVILSLHWGRAGMLIPDEAQRRFAARLAEAGASLVLGHGPHTLQGIERRGRSVIAYSLGNLAFGCRCTDVRDAYLLAFTLDAAAGVTRARAIPIQAGLRDPVRPARDPALASLIADLSRDLGSDATIDGDGAVRIR